MNSEIATSVAWTQADRDKQQTNMALNEFEAALHEARMERRAQRRDHVLVTQSLLAAESRKTMRKAHIAIARVGAQLARIEGPR